MSGYDASRMIPSRLRLTVTVLDELAVLLSAAKPPDHWVVLGLYRSPEILRLYTLDSDSALLLKAARFAIDKAGEGGTSRTVCSLGLRTGR